MMPVIPPSVESTTSNDRRSRPPEPSTASAKSAATPVADATFSMGSTARYAALTPMYAAVTINVPTINALGIVRVGSFVSSEAYVTMCQPP
jgi:hypothetical protein